MPPPFAAGRKRSMSKRILIGGASSPVGAASTGLFRVAAARVLGRHGLDTLRSAYWRAVAKLPIKRSLGESQSDESDRIDTLLANVPVAQTFCEFGFHFSEFNCSRLVRRGWPGLLLDGDAATVAIAKRILAADRQIRAEAACAFLTRENVRSMLVEHFRTTPIGVLSVDVDGNDYWLLQECLPLTPGMIVVEYNASFGTQPITTPYDPTFIRHEKHPSGWYHGASITALTSLCAAHGYALADVSSGGQNLFLVRDDLLGRDVPVLDPTVAYKENALRNQWSGTTASHQWSVVSHMPFDRV
jgi:hypothetical protein